MLLRDKLRQITGFRTLTYTVRAEGEWATIFISLDKRKTGFQFSVTSSYIDGGHYWSSPGEDWRSFLKDLDMEYFGGKILRGSCYQFDPDKTILTAKQSVLEWRREGTLSQEEARNMWDELESLDCDFSYKEQWESFVSVCPRWLQDDPHTVYGMLMESPSRSLVGFWERIWPEFLKQI